MHFQIHLKTHEQIFKKEKVILSKFEVLKFNIDHNIDIFLISESKRDDSSPTTKFLIKGFSTPYRFDRNSKDGARGFLYP